MKSFCIFFTLFFLSIKSFGLTIYVDPGNTDDVLSNSQKTLYGAYNRILRLYPGKTVKEIVNIYIMGNVFLAELPQDISVLVWEINGTIDLI